MTTPWLTIEEAAAYAEEKLCCHKKEHAAKIRALIDKPGEEKP